MRFEEAEQLKPGTLLTVRPEVLDVDDGDADLSETLALVDVVERDGYIYRFTHLLADKHFPVQATSLATGKHMEFHLAEVEIIKEQDDDIL